MASEAQKTISISRLLDLSIAGVSAGLNRPSLRGQCSWSLTLGSKLHPWFLPSASVQWDLLKYIP